MKRIFLTLTFSACSLAFINMPLGANAGDQQNHWGYQGNTGPSNWQALDQSYALCGEGKIQSPINITQAAQTTKLAPLNITYSPVEPSIANNGHTIQIDVPAGNSFSDRQNSYSLAQFHFHTPSEYQINGKTYPMEMHFVHKRNDGTLAVIGVMVEEGKENMELAKLWQHLPQKAGEKHSLLGTTIQLANLLPADQHYYRFMGSLTTPPCSEGVNWFVMQQPITASKEQIAAFRALYPMNARPIQPTNNRLIQQEL